MGTSTSPFGVGRRESHDSTDFYARFSPPEISVDDRVASPGRLDVIHVGDSRRMTKDVAATPGGPIHAIVDAMAPDAVDVLRSLEQPALEQLALEQPG
jgi:hypothetical protein